MSVMSEAFTELANRTLELLKKIEWGGDEAQYRCPFCGGYRRDGHKMGCELNQMIIDLE